MGLLGFGKADYASWLGVKNSCRRESNGIDVVSVVVSAALGVLERRGAIETLLLDQQSLRCTQCTAVMISEALAPLKDGGAIEMLLFG